MGTETFLSSQVFVGHTNEYPLLLTMNMIAIFK